MTLRISLSAVAAVAALGATLTGFGAADSASALTARERCELRCRANAMCMQQCENLSLVRRSRRVVVIRVPTPEEPPVAKNWIDPAFNPTTGGGGGGGGGGGR